MTHRVGVDRDQEGSEDKALEDPYRKRRKRGGDSVIGDIEGALG